MAKLKFISLSRLIFLSLLSLFILAQPAIGHDAKIPAEPYPVMDGMGGDFTLQSTLGRPASLSEFKGKVVLMFFGYTSCPDICPIVLAKFNSIKQQLGPERAKMVQGLFVTVDSKRDTPEKLKAYLDYFDPKMVGFTGSVEDLMGVALKYGTVFFENEGTEETGPLFAHGDYVYLIDDQGRLRELFNSETKVHNITHGVASLLPAS